MWNLASNCLAGSTKKDILRPAQDVIDSSDDEASSVTSREEGLECPICWESFNIVENVPYVLWCGHTLCKNCILGLQWAVVKFPTLPIQLPLFVSCPWCNLLSLRLVYKGNLKFPRKNFFLLWMLESMNGDRVKSHSVFRGDQQQAWSSGGKAMGNSSIWRAHYMHRPESSGSNHSNTHINSYIAADRLRASLQKSLVFFVHLTAKFPLVVIFLLITLYAIPASAAILALYILITVLFALPSFLILYFAYPSLDWLLKPRVIKNINLIVASGKAISSSTRGSSGGRFYFNVTGFPFPLGPFLNRRTIRTEAVKDSIWLFEQEQALGFSSVSTNIRMTVIKLKSGGLWVHAPIAPTKECIELVKELGAPVEYIVLPTFAYEHKIFVGPFSRKFPRAQVWVAPRQWSWPLNLPLEFFGIFRAKTLKDDDTSTTWADEIEQKVLSAPEVGIGPYVEVAFYHKHSRTLLVTDAVIFVPRQPPECISKESLLASAKNGLAVKVLSKGKEVPNEPVVDDEKNRQKGWERMVLQILFLGPSNLLEPNASFAQMSQKLIVSPIVKTLVFSKVPEKVRDWIDSIVRDWRFKRIIPAHFAAPINASRSDILAAFAFLDDLLGEQYVTRPSLSLLFTSLLGKAASYFPPDDMRTLSSLDEFLVSVGVVKKTVSGRKGR